MSVFHPFAHISVGAQLQRDSLTALRGTHSGGALQRPRRPAPEINHRTEVAKMQLEGLRALSNVPQRHEFKSQFIFFSLARTPCLQVLPRGQEQEGGESRKLQAMQGWPSEFSDSRAPKSRSQVQSPSGSVSFSLFHSHRLKALTDPLIQAECLT